MNTEQKHARYLQLWKLRRKGQATKDQEEEMYDLAVDAFRRREAKRK